MDLKLVQPFGYGEMYEWAAIPNEKFGHLVTFDDIQHDKVRYAKPGEYIIGVSSINFKELSDNDNKWFAKYWRDKFGDCVLKEIDIAVGKKEYDQIDEFAYIKTSKVHTYNPREYDDYDKDVKYVERIDRQEWIPVILLGKVIIVDDGNCKSGEWCQIYNGADEAKFGTVVPWDGKTNQRWYVIRRFSENTIKILYK